MLNVCGELSDAQKLGCPTGSAVCNGTKSLGVFKDSLTVNSAGNLKLRYSSGAFCSGGKSTTTTVTFQCAPGLISSSPRLEKVSADQCLFEVMWHTGL